MDMSFLAGVAFGVVLGVLVMSMLTFRSTGRAKPSDERIAEATFGMMRAGAPARRRNKRPRDRDTAEEVNSGLKMEDSLI